MCGVSIYVFEAEAVADELSARIRRRRARRRRFFIFERFGERGFVHYWAARSIDEVRGGLHLREILRGDQVARFGKQRNVQVMKSDSRKSDRSSRIRRATLFRSQPARDGVVIEGAHVETFGAAGHFASDAAEADDAESLSPDVGAAELIEIPAGPGAGAQPGFGFERRRATAIIIVQAMSAVVSSRTPGVFVAATLWWVQAEMSRLS